MYNNVCGCVSVVVVISEGGKTCIGSSLFLVVTLLSLLDMFLVVSTFTKIACHAFLRLRDVWSFSPSF